MDDHGKKIESSDRIQWTERFTVTARNYYSIAWLIAAETSRGLAAEIGEALNRPNPSEYDRMRSHVLTAVVSSWAFLESNVNELFDDAAHYLAEFPPKADAPRGPTAELQQRMAALWPHIERLRTIEKYEIALDLAEAAPIAKGTNPGQDVSLLNRVRNHFIHYTPKPVRDGVSEGADAQMSSAMTGRVRLPDWDRGSEDLFPVRVICPDLARWSIEAAVRYADEFSSRTGLFAGYSHARPTWL